MIEKMTKEETLARVKELLYTMIDDIAEKKNVFVFPRKLLEQGCEDREELLEMLDLREKIIERAGDITHSLIACARAFEDASTDKDIQFADSREFMKLYESKGQYHLDQAQLLFDDCDKAKAWLHKNLKKAKQEIEKE